MSFLFGKKQSVQAIAEPIEDGRAMFDQEMKRIKYRHYEGKEPEIAILVRVQPEGESPFETRMKAGISKAYLLKPGVRVQVKYDPGRKQAVILDDDLQAILQRNPQLIKKE
jgi:hypothetical protein